MLLAPEFPSRVPNFDYRTTCLNLLTSATRPLSSSLRHLGKYSFSNIFKSQQYTFQFCLLNQNIKIVYTLSLRVWSHTDKSRTNLFQCLNVNGIRNIRNCALLRSEKSIYIHQFLTRKISGVKLLKKTVHLHNSQKFVKWFSKNGIKGGRYGQHVASCDLIGSVTYYEQSNR